MIADKRQRHRWTREDEILCLALYYHLPPEERNKTTNPKIQALAEVLDISPGSIKLKLQNIKSLDKSYTANGRKGLVNASRLSREIAAEFIGNRAALFQQADILKRQYGLDADYRPVARTDGAT